MRAVPTVVVLKPDGTELGRIVGFRPPAEFQRLLGTLRRGKTVAAIVARTLAPGTSHGDLVLAVKELQERGSPLAALDLIRRFHAPIGETCCVGLSWRTELILQHDVYRDLGNWAAGRREEPPEVPDEPSVAMLRSLLALDPSREEPAALARVLRAVRRADTVALGSRAPVDDLTAQERHDSGSVLYDGGACEEAAWLWRWAVRAGISWGEGDFLLASTMLLVTSADLDVAETFARKAVTEAQRRGASTALPELHLARVLAARGRWDEAIATAREAARVALDEGRLVVAHAASRVARLAAREESDAGPAPPFERWPW